MKSFRLPVSGLLLSFTLCLQAQQPPAPSLEAAALLVNQEEMTHEFTLEAAFPRPMVEDAAVGKTADSPAKITPAWAGKWVWESPRVAKFVPSEAPKMGTTYEVAMKSGLKDLGGAKVDGGKAVKVKSPGLQITSESRPIYPEDRPPNARQTPTLLLMNAPVSSESLRNATRYVDANGRSATATARFARWEELSTSARANLVFSDQMVRQQPALATEDIPERSLSSSVSWALVITPDAPLPAGEDWELAVDGSISAAENSKLKLGQASRFKFGTILPGTVRGIEQWAPVDGENSITINFDKRVELTPEIAAKFVRITPAVEPAPKAEASGTSLTLTSPGFAFNSTYKVEVLEGFPAADGLPISNGRVEPNLVFVPNRPSVALPSTNEVQLTNGRGVYPIDYVNVRSLKVRVREIPSEELPKVLRSYQNYTNGMGDEGEGRRYGFPLAAELIPGTEIFNETIKLDPVPEINRSGNLELEWETILKGKRPAALFVQVEGLRPIGRDDGGVALGQSVVQISDLGLAWKNGDEDMLVYAFSHTTGAPVPDTELSIHNRDGNVVHSARTDKEGLARFPKPADADYIRARNGKDSHATLLQLDDPNYSPWRLGASYYDWRQLKEDKRGALIFTDRGVYRPGETVHVAGLVRDFKVSLPLIAEEKTATLKLLDDNNRVFHEEEITLGSCGQFGASVKLPEASVGYYHASITLPMRKVAAKSESEDEGSDSGDEEETGDEPAVDPTQSTPSFAHYFMVQEFKRNTFELSMPVADSFLAPATIELPVTATYYLGAPVSKGDLRWSAHFSSQGFYPENFRDFLFADQREFDGGYWSYYYGLDYYYSPQRSTAYLNGEMQLDAVGAAKLIIEVPEEKEFPSPRRAFITSEVTDANQQTLSVQAQTMLHPADFYLGIGRPGEVIRAGDKLSLPLVAVTPDGKKVPQPVEASLIIQKKTWNTIEVKQAGGGMVKRNEESMVETARSSIVITEGARTDLSFAETGEYHVTIEAKDSAERIARTTVQMTVHGADYYAWEGLEGVRVDLLPDKKIYQPGDTARLLVKTPIAGTALVTVEREGIERAFVTKLAGSAPVIEVPLSDMDAPNTHVGVMIVEGAAASQLKFPMPRAKFGYTRLTIEQRLPKLTVAVRPMRESVRPGGEATVAVKVTDHAGKAVTDASIIFTAVDEGVLAVTGFENPDPLGYFHPSRSLRVRTSATFPNLLAENPEELSAYNKGYIIGGGDGAGMGRMKTRTDFTPCAHFAFKARTDATGQASITFTTPDTLTRYRLVAVVAAPDGWRFGTGTANLEVTKPLMLEPSPPRFAHVGDIMVVRALLLNQSPVDGVFSVVLEPDSLVALQSTPRAEVALAAGAQQTVEFTVNFAQAGTTKWRWRATPVRFNGNLPPDLEPEMNDSVETTFKVEHPVPILREIFHARLNPQAKEAALLETASPNLRAGDGQVLVSIANTRLVDALPAVRHLQGYPYGCVEQTSSGMMPWLVADSLRQLLPETPSAEAGKKAIAMGVRRLTSMQTNSGGLGYWPGADEPDFWGSVAAAHVLMLAKQGGHEVADSLLDPLVEYLKNGLVEAMGKNDNYYRATSAKALYVLALAGKADVAIMNKLATSATLSKDYGPESALYLALAFATTKDGKEEAARLLASWKAPEKGNWTWWYDSSILDSLRVQAMASAGMDRSVVEPVVEEMLAARNAEGDWGSTYTNSAAVFALAAYHRTYEKNFGAAKAVVAWEGQSRDVTLDAKPQRATIVIGLHEMAPGARPVIQLADGPSLYVQTELAARPTEMPRKRNSPAFSIERIYRKVQPDGTLVPEDNFRVGDLVAVSLNVKATGSHLYLAVDDPLPASLEAVNPEFTSQGGNEAAMSSAQTWASDHTELRDSRALFFMNNLYRGGEYTITYLARVSKAGNAFAPPTKIEAMYDPTSTALGEGGPFRTSP
ncbi:MAG: alpha-2-macroglobulin family protein [Verrucomicrobiales bacterium]